MRCTTQTAVEHQFLELGRYHWGTGEACGLRDRNTVRWSLKSASAAALSAPGRCFATKVMSYIARNIARMRKSLERTGSRVDFLLTAQTAAVLSH